MSMAAWPSMRPASPSAACARAASMTRGRSVARSRTTSSAIMMGPPTNSAAINCQPSTTASNTLSSTTRFVDANWKAMAAIKSAPLRNNVRANAVAAYEHEEEAAPSADAFTIVFADESGSKRLICALETTASTTDDSKNPRHSAQRISHAMVAVIASASIDLCSICSFRKLPIRKLALRNAKATQVIDEGARSSGHTVSIECGCVQMPLGNRRRKGDAMAGMRAHTEYLTLTTRKRYEMVHLTPQVEAIVERSGVVDGLCFVSPMHITAAIYVNDNEDGLIEDISTWLEKLAPAWPGYKHHRTGEDNGDAHLKSLLLHHESTLPVTNGRLDLGTWQRIFYAEFDGQRAKRIIVKVLGLEK